MTDTAEKTPSEWANEGDPYDCSAWIGQLLPSSSKPRWPMISYERPANILWNAIAGALHQRGWSDDRIKEWLQSKEPRWALNGDLGTALEKLGADYAATVEW